jgi:hypothetical protein
MAKHNVFISHRHEDDHLIAKLKDMLATSGCEIRDSSVTASNPNQAKDEGYIKSILAERMQWAGKLLVVVSPQTKNHEWVDWEIEYANKHPEKRIIGVWAPGAEACDLPEALERHADAVVTWDAAQISAALDGADNWQQPNGAEAPPRAIRKIGC